MQAFVVWHSAMKNPRCDNCKHWRSKPEGYERKIEAVTSLGFGTCSRAIPLWDASEFSGKDENFERRLLPEFIGRKFFAQDGSDYHAIVLTAPDFYCAEFEAK